MRLGLSLPILAALALPHLLFQSLLTAAVPLPIACAAALAYGAVRLLSSKIVWAPGLFGNVKVFVCGSFGLGAAYALTVDCLWHFYVTAWNDLRKTTSR